MTAQIISQTTGQPTMMRAAIPAEERAGLGTGTLWERVGGRKPKFTTYKLAAASRGARYRSSQRRAQSLTSFRGPSLREFAGVERISTRIDNTGVRRTERHLAVISIATISTTKEA